MAAPETLPVNHHADHPGFSGVTGAIVGLMLLWMGRANARLAADLTGVSTGDRVVDIGCGPGGAVREAARRGARVTGVDPAPVMLRLARTFTRDAVVEWVEGTAESVPLPDGSATVLWSLATVHHWKDVGLGLGEAHRLLAPNGRLARHRTPVTTGCDRTGQPRVDATTGGILCGAMPHRGLRRCDHRSARPRAAVRYGR